MSKEKLMIGDICEVLPITEEHDKYALGSYDLGEVLIEGSYADLHGKSKDRHNSNVYSVIYVETGRSFAWMVGKFLKYIRTCDMEEYRSIKRLKDLFA